MVQGSNDREIAEQLKVKCARNGWLVSSQLYWHEKYDEHGRLLHLDFFATPKLFELPQELLFFTHLQTLHIVFSSIRTLPPEIGQLTHLRRLDLVNTQLTALPQEIGHLTRLHQLTLLGNQLTALPQELGELTNLRFLSLWGNQLTMLPSEIKHLVHLESLELLGNQFAFLPPEIGQLANLRHFVNGSVILRPNQFTPYSTILMYDSPEGRKRQRGVRRVRVDPNASFDCARFG